VKREKKKQKLQEIKQCRFEKFETAVIERQQIKNADYNPRNITAEAKKKLRKNLEAVGLVGPITWNRRTGNIVSGHQRISILDALEGTYEYKITVAAVDMDEKTEREQNIFMNNTDVQGTFDFEKLELMVPEIDLESAGLEFVDIFKAFGDTAVDSKKADELAELSNRLHDTVKTFEALKKTSNDRNDTEFYCVVVFKNHEERKAFTDLVKAEDNRYVDGRRLTEIINQSQKSEACPELEQEAGA